MIGAVLCGGQSVRMGWPKALLPWKAGDLLSHALGRLRAAGFAPVCLGPAEWANTHGASYLPDELRDCGPLGGVLSALRLGDLFLMAVDMPWLEADEMRALAAVGEAARILTLPVEDGMLTALCGYWPGELAQPLAAYLQGGGRKVIGFAQGVPHRFLRAAELSGAGVRPEHLRGLNTPEEYAAAVDALRGEEDAR